MFGNRHVKALKPYSLVTHGAWECQGEEGVLKLDWNESTIPPSPKVKESIEKFLKSGNMHWYPDVNNSIFLNELVKYNGLPLENIQYFASSDSLHEYIVRAFIEPGDRIAIVAPTYDNFRAVVESNGALTEYYHLDKNFRLTQDNFESYLDLYQPKIAYICNPNNPTGTIYDKEFLELIISRFQNVLFIIDEAYYEFVGSSSKDLVLDYDNLIISRTFSKAFGLASFRVGYALSSQHNIKMLSKVRNPKNISTFSQIAAISVLQDLEYMRNYVNQVNDAKAMFSRGLSDIGIKSSGQGGNFLLLHIDVSKKYEFINYLEKRNVFVRDYGHVIGMEGYVRITIGTMHQMKHVLSMIKDHVGDGDYT